MRRFKQDPKAVANAFLSMIKSYAKQINLKGFHDIDIEHDSNLVTVVVDTPEKTTLMCDRPLTPKGMQLVAKELAEHVQSFSPAPLAKDGNLMEVSA